MAGYGLPAHHPKRFQAIECLFLTGSQPGAMSNPVDRLPGIPTPFRLVKGSSGGHGDDNLAEDGIRDGAGA
jgi:hypothetical protein